MSNSWAKNNTQTLSNISIKSTLTTFVVITIFVKVLQSLYFNTTQYLKLFRSLVEATKSYTLRYAYYLWASRTLSATGFSLSYNRSGITAAKLVIELAVAFLLFNILFPIAMNQAVTASTGAWNSAVALVFGVVVPILVAIAAVEHFLPF